MSKQLYPKRRPPVKKRKKTPSENLMNRPYHVLYTDPDKELDPEWGHYDSELAVRVDSWYRVKVLGFHKAATLYDRDEALTMREGEINE